MTTGFKVDCHLDEAHGVHVLQFAARAEVTEVARFHEFLVGTGTADGNVHVRAQVAVLHVTVTCAKVAHDLTQFADIGRSFFGTANVGAGHDFHQCNACAVEVDEGHVRVHVVDRFTRILFEVDTFDTDLTRCAVAHFDQHFTFANDGVVKLGNLVALRKVRVEIVFAVKRGPKVDLCLQAQTSANGLCHATFVDDGQHTGHTSVHKCHVRVRLCAEFSRSPREQFCLGRDLRVHLKADHEFPIAGRPCDHFGFRSFISEVEHRFVPFPQRFSLRVLGRARQGAGRRTSA